MKNIFIVYTAIISYAVLTVLGIVGTSIDCLIKISANIILLIVIPVIIVLSIIFQDLHKKLEKPKILINLATSWEIKEENYPVTNYFIKRILE